MPANAIAAAHDPSTTRVRPPPVGSFVPVYVTRWGMSMVVAISVATTASSISRIATKPAAMTGESTARVRRRTLNLIWRLSHGEPAPLDGGPGTGRRARGTTR